METITTDAPRSRRRSSRMFVIAIAVGIAAVVVFFMVDGLVRDPAVVPRIEVRNQTPEVVEVLARGDAGPDLVPVAVVEPERSTVAYDVVDQGARWTFVVRVSGDTVAKLRFTRDELERADWTVVVPDSDAAASTGG